MRTMTKAVKQIVEFIHTHLHKLLVLSVATSLSPATDHNHTSSYNHELVTLKQDTSKAEHISCKCSFKLIKPIALLSKYFNHYYLHFIMDFNVLNISIHFN